MSFTATRVSKFLAYIPLIGTAIGLHRIYKAFQEYLLFRGSPLNFLGNRSLYWIGRGVLEVVPGVGGAICLGIDIVSSIANSFFRKPRLGATGFFQ